MRQLQLVAHGKPSDVIELNTVSELALGQEERAAAGCPATAGQNAGVVVPVTGGLADPIKKCSERREFSYAAVATRGSRQALGCHRAQHGLRTGSWPGGEGSGGRSRTGRTECRGGRSRDRRPRLPDQK